MKPCLRAKDCALKGDEIVKTLLRVLVVEDSEDDTELELRQLRSGGYDLKWERVETPEAMSSALDREQWDVIICDYRMPNFNAPAALKLVQDRKIDIPFIIVSGTIGEDTAIAMMKAGAHDYLMKNKLARLVVAVERETSEAKIRREKKKTEEELQRSEQSFRSISENAHDGMIVALRNGAYIFANRRASEITGYAINEILKVGLEGIAYPDESLKLSERRKKILAGENVPNQYDTVIVHKGGNAVPIEITSARTLWYGQVADIFVFRDITERKRVELALGKSEERFRIAAESTSDCVWEWDFEKASVDWFGDIDSLLGYRRDEFPRTIDAWGNAVHPEDHDRVMDLLDKHIADHTPYDAKYRVVKKDGSIAFWVDRGTALLDENGKAYRMIGAVKDITESKRAAEALKKSEEKYRLLAENLSDVIWTMGTNLRYTYVSPSVTRLRGYSVEEAMAQTLEENMTLSSIEAAMRIMAEEEARQAKGQSDQNRSVTLESELFCKDGSTVWVENKITYMRSAAGRITGYLGVSRDITERKRAEEDLVKYKDHLEELVKERTVELDKAKIIAEKANKAKSDFLANMSHEIRTPLSSIIGFSELLYDGVSGPLNDNQKKYLGYVTSSGEHLLSLINDILDLSKVEAGKMELLPTSFSMSDLLKTSFSFIAEKALKHNIRLRSEISSGVDVIEADERKVKQIIYNLLSNAVKFTPDGGSITVTAEIISSDSTAIPLKICKGLPDTKYVLVSVKDTGIGIAKKDQSKLFTEFHQIEEPYSKKYEGTGLGLALSKKLVKLHGGKIWFESKGKGKGCTFYFILPLKILPKA